MGLKQYILNGPSVVILLDKRDPMVSWQHHLDRTSGLRGGVDLVAVIGTPIFAPTDGIVHWYKNLGGAGNTIYFAHDHNPDWQDVFSHLSNFAGYDGKHFRQGEIIGWTGNTGGVAQHLHRHLVDPGNVRRNPWLYFNNLSTAGATPVPLAIIPKDIQTSFQTVLSIWKDPLTGKPFYDGLLDGVFGTKSWLALQRYMETQGAYTDAVDGIPDPRTYKGMQILAQRGGYTGLLDGDPGPYTYAGLRDWLLRAMPSPATPTPVPAPTPVPVPVPAPVTMPVPPAGGYMFGVDIGTTQAAMDMSAFTKAGGEFVIIKMGGGNASDSPYTAPKYRAELTAARANGLPVAHYWFNGQKVPVADQARYFRDNVDLREGDVLALDVEAETETSTRPFTPVEVVEFIDIVAERFPGIKVLIYMSASLTRDMDWTIVASLGHPLWVAAYGVNDGKPGPLPAINHWTHWTVWQYTSKGGVPGYLGDIDHNFALSELFISYGWRVPVVAPVNSALIAELKALVAKYE